jgi:hypothetical protein
MRSEISRPHCHYRQLENGVHEFVFLSNTRLAVDDYFAILETSPMAQGEKVADILHVLIELREPGMPPVAYMVQRYRDFIKVHKEHLPAVRTAYLYRTGFIISVVRSFLRLITTPKQTNRRFFPISDRAQAEAWLLNEAKPDSAQPA